MARCHRGRCAHTYRPLRRHAARHASRGTGRARRAKAAIARAALEPGDDRRSHHRPRAPGRIRAESRAAGRPARRAARQRSGPDDQSGVCVGAAGRRARRAGDPDSGSRRVVLAGGIESMSRMPYLIDSEDARWGHKMGNFTLVDAMYRDGFFCPLSRSDHGPDGRGSGARSTASRATTSDALRARESAPRRAARSRPDDSATRSRRRRDATRKGKPVELEVDEHPRAGHDDRGAAQAAAGVRSGRRAAGHHHRRLVVWHHRRRRGGRADERGRSGARAA